MKRFTFAAICRVLPPVLLASLSACSGGGGGTSPGNAPVPTYQVGGSITGLTMAGLVLANGSDTVSPAVNASSFVFAVAVANGGSYSVSVQTQPANATCTVTNGTGTVAAAAVTSVQINCSLNTYQIGGTISGLTATGLVLASGGDTFTAPINATRFVFAIPIAVGNSYNVTVKTQPTGFNCTIANGSGTVAAIVNNVVVTCKAIPAAAWSNAMPVGTGLYPSIANDPSDVAFFVAWCNCTGAGGIIDAAAPSQASRFTDADGWTTPATMAMTHGGGLTGMQFDAQGKGFALWAGATAQNDGSVDSLYSRYTPNVGWAYGPVDVQLPNVTLPANSVVAYASLPPLGLSVALDGTASVLVEQVVQILNVDGTGERYLNPAAGGAAPGSDVLKVGSYDGFFPASDSTVTQLLDNNGKPIPGKAYFGQQVFWPFRATTSSTVPGQYATQFTVVDTIPTPLPDGSMGGDIITNYELAMRAGSVAPTILLFKEDLLQENTNARGHYRLGVSDASTTIAANGDALVAWSIVADDFGSVTYYAQRFVNGTWQGLQVLYTSTGQMNPDGNYRFVPVTALDGAGNGLIVFPIYSAQYSLTGTTSLMAVKLDAASGAFSTATQIEAADVVPVSLKMNFKGDAFLLEAGAVRRYDAASNIWGAQVVVGADDPVLDLDKTGNAMVAWSSGGTVYARRYH
jgi:hypothetical protein